MNRLEGKVAIVTGGGSGIGRATSISFAAEGASVIVADINEAGGHETVEAIALAGHKAQFVRADVSVAADASALAEAAVEQFGSLTVLVNNAGTATGDTLALHELDEAVWEHIHAVNLRGPFLCCKYALPKMIEAGGGSIVNIASAAAVGMAPRAAYASSKGGVVALTRSIAFQYGQHNIRANAICPGPVETPLSRAARESGIYKAPIVDSLIPRRAQPEEIASVALYLASDEAGYVTSDVVMVDGGALRLKKELILPN